MASQAQICRVGKQNIGFGQKYYFSRFWF